MTAIVLAGHGSSVSPETGGLVRGAADLLREWGVADEVATAFWKEPPYFHEAANSLQSNTMIVVPVFAARGWYVDVVLPRELAQGLKDVEYVITPPIGEHPRMAELIEEAVQQALGDGNGSNSAVIIVGHGTSRHPGSRDTTFAIVEKLRAQQIAAEVEAAFLDDEPTIEAAIEECRSLDLVVVTNFIAQGEHVRADVPEVVSKAVANRTQKTRSLKCARPNLTAQEIAKMAQELAGDVVMES